MNPKILLPIGTMLVVLSACETMPTSPEGAGQTTSGTLQSDVEIFEGTTFTATWLDSPQTTIRLAYAATTPVTDLEATEIAERLSGCQATGGAIETDLIGGLASVRIPAACGR